MRHGHRAKELCVLAVVISLVQSTATRALPPPPQGTSSHIDPLIAARIVPASLEPLLSTAAKLALLRQRIKYVFVLFQENRSFEQHFGTFPGARGLFPASGQPGLVQPIVNTDKSVGTISPFLIPQSVRDTNGAIVPLFPADIDSADHSRTGIVNDIDVVGGLTRNDRFALNAEGLTTDARGGIVSRLTGAPLSTMPPPTLLQKQRAELVMSHLNCDTIPFLWQYADRFTLFDNFFMTVIAPSSPNAVAMIAGQSGATQWALHPDQGSNNIGNISVQKSGGLPFLNDQGPYAGSDLDRSSAKPPYGPRDVSPAKPTLNQTYASLPLSFMGSDIDRIIATDQNPALDLLDVRSDIRTIAKQDMPVNWGWYQEGYDHEPTDGSGPTTRKTYIHHHNAPQYFGYVGDNPRVASNLHGLGDFFTDVSNNALKGSGVFYVRGGYGNNDGLVPLDPNPTVQHNFIGSDDHPGYSDAQISEALVADAVNAIASSKYWKNSAIVITYDETDGLYDHVPTTIRTRDPFGAPMTAGERIPAIVVSPYASAHEISHQYSEHASIIKFIDRLFALQPLESLPDEKRARALGVVALKQANLTPVDDEDSIGDLAEAFDNARLVGTKDPLDSSYAMIAPAVVHHLPHYDGAGCRSLNIVPTDIVNGTLLDPAPADFNPRPGTTPGLPTVPGWGG